MENKRPVHTPRQPLKCLRKENRLKLLKNLSCLFPCVCQHDARKFIVKGYLVQREMFMCERIPGDDRAAVVVQLLSPGRVIAASREPCNHVVADV